MAFLFFDIETFMDPEDKTSGLNPYKKKSKVLTISYKFYAWRRLANITKYSNLQN